MKIILYPEIGVRFYCQDKNASTALESYFDGLTAVKLTHWDESTVNFRARFNRPRRDVVTPEAEIEFTVVRNTWARIASLYRMLLQQMADDSLHVWFSRFRAPLTKALEAATPFPSFVRFICAQSDDDVDSHWQPQWIGLPLASPSFHIVRLESLERDLKRSSGPLAQIDIASLSHANRTSKAKDDYRDLYDPTSVALVFRRYWKEIELFGYQF